MRAWEKARPDLLLLNELHALYSSRENNTGAGQVNKPKPFDLELDTQFRFMDPGVFKLKKELAGNFFIMSCSKTLNPQASPKALYKPRKIG